jgi:CO dehydrogenase/acetyl-CoA synthase gamma subunit (corrinoid Fe-S protein)
MNDQMSHHELQERLKLIKQHEEEEVGHSLLLSGHLPVHA